MNKQKWLLLAMLAALVVALFVLSVAVSPGGDADPERSGGIEALDGLLGAVPGLGNELDPDDVDAPCFAVDRFVVIADGSCVADVPADVDRVNLRFVVGDCTIEVDPRDERAIAHSLDRGDADDEAKLRIAITGDGARLTFLNSGSNRCEVELR